MNNKKKVDIQDEIKNPLNYPYRARVVCRNCKTGFLVGSREEKFNYKYPCPECGELAVCVAFQVYSKPIKEEESEN